MLIPKANTQNPPLFPIGVDIPFSWDYDKYLLVMPTNLTIEAFPADSPNSIVTIGSGLPGNLKNYTWTAASQKNITNPIRTALYTLRIFDGAVGRFGSLPSAGGYLATYQGLKFGLYIPSPYTSGNQLNPPVCATCEFSKITNGAVHSLVPAVFIVLVVVISSAVLLL
ncbi:hypothetical protein EDD11_005040 [Mortierella claussenii]|nr:hypothetical protein EDD11_005040 [Mortierella claussenii]